MPPIPRGLSKSRYFWHLPIFKLLNSSPAAPRDSCIDNPCEDDKNNFLKNNLNADLIKRICSWKLAENKSKSNFSSTNVPRPFINVQSIKGVTTHWLYDTGAKITVLALREFRKIPIELRPTKIPVNLKLESASNNVIKVIGSYNMPIVVNNKKVTHPVIVVENLNTPAIMGIDLIDKLGISYNSRNREFIFETDSPKFTIASMSTLSTETIPAYATMPMQLSTLTGSQRPGPNIRSMATVQCTDFPLLSGGPGLVVPNHAGHVTVLVQNCGPVDIEIPRGTNMGELENIHHETLTPLDGAKLCEMLEKRDTPKPAPLSEADRKAFLEKLNLNVPDTERKLYEELILANHDIFSKDKNDLGRANNFEHHIEMKSNEPIFRKQYEIPEAHKQLLQTQIQEWLKLGVIQPSRSRYNSPMFLVPKKDGSLRVVQDFRALNANSQDDRYSMKDVSECIGDIGRAGSTIFSTLDLTSGFWQMPLTPESQHLTAFSVPGLGQFEWVMSPMGLLGCPASFQRLVEAAMNGLTQVIVYIDDLLLHTTTHPDHRQRLQLLFNRLRQTGLKVNLKKCEFGATNVSYLGFRLTPNGILPGTDKLKAVRDTPPPSNIHQVRQFTGLCNFFRTHVRNFAQICGPLHKLTHKDTHWKGGPLPPDALKAYKELKQALLSDPIVDYPRQNRAYSLIVDAATGNDVTAGGLGAILCQTDEQGHYRVISYASRALIKHEKNYTPFLLEMMAGVWGMEHFSTYLRGRKFTLYSDHRPLEKLGTVHTKTLNRLQQAMTDFDFVIKYKDGKEMPADFLSRNVCEAIDVFTPDLPRLQQEDPLLHTLIEYVKNHTIPANANAHDRQIIAKVGNECFLEKDILWRRINKNEGLPRTVLVVPTSLRDSLVREAHGAMLSGHEGISKTKERLLHSYYWPNMDRDIMLHLNSCQRCQVTKKQHSAPHLLSPLPQCTAPNQRIHIDLFGPLVTSEHGKKMVLCMTDAFTKYVELVALPNKEAGTTGSAIFNRWICRYGTPLEIVSDNGKEFCNDLAKELYTLMDIQHTTTTPYHPQCNAQAEVCNKTIQKYLAAFVDKSTLDWELYLAPLAFSYNTSLHRSVKATPYFLTFGQDARAPSFPNPDIQRYYGESQAAEWYQTLQLARQLATHHNMRATERGEFDHNKKAHPFNYVAGQMVWLDERNFLHKNRKLAQNWTGPYPITKIHSNGVVVIQKGSKSIVVNVDRIKPYIPPVEIRKINNEFEPTLTNETPENESPSQNEEQAQGAQGAGEWTTVTYAKRNKVKAASPTISDRMTRAMTRARERAALPLESARALVCAINAEARKWEKSVLWYAAPKHGPAFVADEFGLPQRRLGVKQPKWVYNRRDFLKSLSVADRNLLLTGDPGFAFDPVAYDVLYHVPQPALEFPLIAHHLDYIPPPADIARVPTPTPPPSPRRAPSPPPPPPRTPERPSPLPTPSPPPGPYRQVASDSSQADSDPFQSFSDSSGNATPARTKPSVQAKVDDAALLLERLTHQELPGGKLLRSTRPAPPVPAQPPWKPLIHSPPIQLQPQPVQAETPKPTKLWSPGLKQWVDVPSSCSQGVSPARFSQFSPSIRRGRPPPPPQPSRAVSPTSAAFETKPKLARSPAGSNAGNCPSIPTAPASRLPTRPESSRPAPSYTAEATTGRTRSRTAGPLPAGSTVHQGIRVGGTTFVLPEGYTGRLSRPGERVEDFQSGSSVFTFRTPPAKLPASSSAESAKSSAESAKPSGEQTKGKSFLPGFFAGKKK